MWCMGSKCSDLIGLVHLMATLNSTLAPENLRKKGNLMFAVMVCTSVRLLPTASIITILTAATRLQKSCTDKLEIVREIPWDEVLRIVNIGKNCTGRCNTGDCNTGDWNTGNRNTGDCNTGDWNKSSFNTGCFNTEEQKIMLFNKPSDMTYREWIDSDARYLLNQIPKDVVEWVYEEDMTDEEKAAHPTYETTGGYLKVLDESECGQLWWGSLSDRRKDIIRAIPNFDSDIFFQCTGVRVDE